MYICLHHKKNIMENLPKVVQMRGTIFFQQIIGYTPENAAKYKQLLMPEGKVTGIPQVGIPIQGANPFAPQYGMPWQLVNESIQISFFPNKIDIVCEKEGVFGKNDAEFLRLCTEKFSKFKLDGDFPINRLAYAPLFSITVTEKMQSREFWQRILKQISYKGVPFQNIEYNYLLKNIVNINSKEVEMNFLHQLSDGYHITNGQKDSDCVLIKLDINTVPEKPYSFEVKDISAFYSKSIDWEKELIDNILL